MRWNTVILSNGQLGCGTGNAEIAKKGLQVGFGRADATPYDPINISGGDSKNRISVGYRDPINVTCVAISADGDTYLIYTLDYITASSVYTEPAEKLITAATGIPADRIMDTLTEYMTSVDTGGYIGNVGNASQDQKDLISAIFGENMTMQIGNQYYSVSILVKNQQIDNRGQNDMVLYITADQLAVGSGYWSNGWKELTIVPVYGIVFINNGNSYTACDHLFAGEAPVCNFGGDFGSGNVGNFNTNLWNSTDYPDLRDTSGGDITKDYITTNGELDEAYQRYVRENP